MTCRIPALSTAVAGPDAAPSAGERGPRMSAIESAKRTMEAVKLTTSYKNGVQVCCGLAGYVAGVRTGAKLSYKMKRACQGDGVYMSSRVHTLRRVRWMDVMMVASPCCCANNLSSPRLLSEKIFCTRVSE